MSDSPAPVPPQHPLDRRLAAVRRYKWLIVGMFVAAIAAGLAATRLITPQYEVRATIWLQTPDNRQTIQTGPIRSADLLNSNTAWIELFLSYRIVDEVVRQLALFLTPEDFSDASLFTGFALSDQFLPGKYELTIDRAKKTWTLEGLSNSARETGTAADSVGTRIGFRWMLPANAFQGTGQRKARFTVATPRETSLKLIARLDPQLAKGSNFLWLSFSDRNARKAARTLNAWLNEYVRVAADLKRRNLVEYSNILRGQLQYAEQATQDAEAAYQSFRVHTITLPTEGGPVAAGVGGATTERDPALESFFEQKIEYDNLRHDREALEQSLASAAAGTTPYEGLLLIPSVAQNPGADALREAFKSLYDAEARLRVERQSFTDEYPSVKQLLGTVNDLKQQTIPNLANGLLQQLRDRESDYERRIQGASRELQQIPTRTIEERRLQRAVVVAEGLYTNLKNRYAEAQLAEASASPDISVLDTAVAPLKPNKNRAAMVFMMTVAAGLGAAIGLALFLDKFDRKIRYTDQATTELGLLVAGAIPHIPRGGLNASSPEQTVQFLEAFRSLRMHAMHSLPTKQITLAVTSAAPSDGKSLVASNLALSFADAGLRTVLVAGKEKFKQLDQPGTTHLKDGLSEYLAGLLDLKQAIRATPHKNLWFMSGGLRHARSPELLATSRIKELIETLSGMYDVVIVDTPPLAAGMDAYAISTAAGSVMMVLRLGQTERRLAGAKLAVLDRLPVRMLGAVLNDVPSTGEFRYYSYSSGYALTAAGEEQPAIAAE